MSEKVTNGKIVSFTYELKDAKGVTLEKSDHPLEYLHGRNNIIPGLEKALEGLQEEDEKSVKVEAAEAYGEYNKDLRFEVPRQNFPSDIEINPGMEFQTETEDGPLIVTVKESGPDVVIVDGNHPLAGKVLHFDVKIASVRQATEQELSHGHVHHDGHDH